MTSLVYFIQIASGPVKIGTTRNLKKRLKGIAWSLHEPFVVLGIMEGDVKVERELHKRFAAYHLHHEWFEPSDEIISLARSLDTERPDKVQDQQQCKFTLEARRVVECSIGVIKSIEHCNLPHALSEFAKIVDTKPGTLENILNGRTKEISAILHHRICLARIEILAREIEWMGRVSSGNVKAQEAVEEARAALREIAA